MEEKTLPHYVNAIDPSDEEIAVALYYPDHFGKGHGAIRFDGFNMPFHSEHTIEFEEYS